MKIIADATLPNLKVAFPKPFVLDLYANSDELKGKIKNQEILLCRSTLKVTQNLLENSAIRHVATASSGVDHIDKDYLDSANISLVSAKGANAESVADYILASLVCVQKSHPLTSKKAGIIGAGEVGSKVAQRLQLAGFIIFLYDPLRELRDLSFQSCSLEDLFQCSLLCIHAELHNTLLYPSLNMVNAEFLSHLSPGTVIINAARGGIVNEKELLLTQQKFIYCTDVYENEPEINKKIIDFAFLCTPHIAGHSIEAKLEAIALISRYFHKLLGLPSPICEDASSDFSLSLLPHGNWQEPILSFYDPSIESRFLKQSANIRDSFLSLRKQHDFRHDLRKSLDLESMA